MTKLNGFLDHLRENLEVLDEQIATARKMSKPKGKADKAAALQWAKTLRDLVELRNTTLDRIKLHLLGRYEGGSMNEPNDIWENNSEMEFERSFKRMLSPWTQKDLELKCEKCGVDSEEVTTREGEYEGMVNWDLCDKCNEKKNDAAKSNEESDDAEPTAEPDSKADMKVLLQSAALQIRALRLLPVDQRIIELEKLLAENPIEPLASNTTLTPISLSQRKQASPASEGAACVRSGGQVTPVTRVCGGSS